LIDHLVLYGVHNARDSIMDYPAQRASDALYGAADGARYGVVNLLA
jgi:hypothetical protein